MAERARAHHGGDAPGPRRCEALLEALLQELLAAGSLRAGAGRASRFNKGEATGHGSPLSRSCHMLKNPELILVLSKVSLSLRAAKTVVLN